MQFRTLFRPIGWRELELIAASGWTAFPPRLAWQPIFYPVLNQGYAEQIAKEWNAADAFSGNIGIVTAFDLPDQYLDGYEVRHVGGEGHDELWIPAAELDGFNNAIQGPIRIIAAFPGDAFNLDARDPLLEIVKSFIVNP